MAPEVHVHRKATALSDIFSLHVVMWEVSFHFAVPILVCFVGVFVLAPVGSQQPRTPLLTAVVCKEPESKQPLPEQLAC